VSFSNAGLEGESRGAREGAGKLQPSGHQRVDILGPRRDEVNVFPAGREGLADLVLEGAPAVGREARIDDGMLETHQAVRGEKFFCPGAVQEGHEAR